MLKNLFKQICLKITSKNSIYLLSLSLLRGDVLDIEINFVVREDKKKNLEEFLTT